MREFVVNKYITLKLKKGKTVIYVNNTPFYQCKFLLLTIPVDKIESLDEVESIDEAAEKLDRSLEAFDEKPHDVENPPDDEFWGHCSNLQVWDEHDYNTRLLHSNLAFPLLKKLADVGDPQAKKAFKKEIIERFLQGSKSTIMYLIDDNYLNFLNRDELLSLFLNSSKFAITYLITNNYLKSLNRDKLWALFPKEGPVLEHLEKKLNGTFDLKVYLKSYPYENNMGIDISVNKRIKGILIRNRVIDYDCLEFISENYKNLKLLRGLSLSNNEIRRLPESFGKLKMIEFLGLKDNQLTRLPESFGNLIHLKTLHLGHNRLRTLPESIENLTSLKWLFLNGNQLKRLPETIGNIKNLKILNLSANNLRFLPNSLENLKSLRSLALSENPLIEIPKYICDLPFLKILTLDFMQIEKFSNEVEKLEKKNVTITYI